MATSVEDGEKSAFPRRLLAVARYTVVSMVSIIAVAVIAKALSSILKHKDVRLVIVGGSVVVERFRVYPPEFLIFRFLVRTYNPTGGNVTYKDVWVNLIDESDNNPFYAFMTTQISDIDLLPQTTLDTHSRSWYTSEQIQRIQSLHTVISALSEGNSFTIALRLNGTLLAYHPSGRTVATIGTFYCWPMTAGFNPGSGDDISCVSG